MDHAFRLVRDDTRNSNQRLTNVGRFVDSVSGASRHPAASYPTR